MIAYKEKPAFPITILSGTYILSKRAMSAIPAGQPIHAPCLINTLIEAGEPVHCSATLRGGSMSMTKPRLL